MRYLHSNPQNHNQEIKHKNFKDLRERQEQLELVEEFISMVKNNNDLNQDESNKINPYIDRLDHQASFCRSIINKIQRSGFKAHLFPDLDSAWSDLILAANLAEHYQAA